MVEKGSPAEKANVLIGDIIVAIDSIPVVSRDDFTSKVRKNPNKELILQVKRNGKTIDIKNNTRCCKSER
ncbi:MAG: PDZ domain-containing protein [Candidatus Edwardsbacteria bacterium]